MKNIGDYMEENLPRWMTLILAVKDEGRTTERKPVPPELLDAFPRGTRGKLWARKTKEQGPG